MTMDVLAVRGAEVLVASMPTGAWEPLRRDLVPLLRPASVKLQLELHSDLNGARALVVADPGWASTIEAELRGELLRFLRLYPESAGALDTIVEKYSQMMAF
ncbi:hypothetical protein AB0P21_19740 [Kribbella sp. NPDC056861]|uniref:hypothetical protein n=1 Tax=Kribbella sp. NPDC056861 TaxID=3154857 RepID=UPI00343DE594